MRKLLTLVSLIFIGNCAFAQDVSVIAITSPVSGCSLSAASSVTVNVKNIGLTDLSAVPIDLAYTINGGPPVTDAAVTFPFFAPNTTISYTFTVPADLSAPATYIFTAYSTLATDINTTNDATTGYSVTSTATSVGGSVSGGTNVCLTSNSGVLTLSGHTGSILNWEYSIDAGTTFISISNTTTTQSYTNLTVPTIYRAKVQNGGCAVATSSSASMTIDPVSKGGTVTSNKTVCSGANNGTLTAAGARVGTITKWQKSINGGALWTDIANVTTTQTYTNLVTTTKYRVEVKSGSCSVAYSTVATITVSPTSVGGAVTGGGTACSGSNNGTLTLAGQTGSVSRWESSTDAGATWTTIANATTSQSYTNLVTTTWYRAYVQSGSCSATYSSPDSIVVTAGTVAGSISSDSTVCSGVNSGLLKLNGYVGAVQYWEYSTDGGGSYTTINNITDTLTYLNLTTTTLYRANVLNGGCGASNSTIATVTVSPISVGGITSMNDVVCNGANSGNITLSGHTGSVSYWQVSTDGVIWSDSANTTTTQSYTNLIDTTYFRAIVTSGVCAADTSTIDTITVDAPSVGGTISSSAHVCNGINSDTLRLNGNVGNVVRWEYSIDGGINWIVINNTTTSYIYTNVTLTTLYRAFVQNGSCSLTVSDTATLTVDPLPVGGIVNGGTTVCGGANAGSLTLTGYSGTVQNWESSLDNGLTWSAIVNATATQNYLNDVSTTLYRAIVSSGVCANDTSTIATITVDSATVGGVLSSVDTVCAGLNANILHLSGKTGSILNWEASFDNGTTWLTLANSSPDQAYKNLTETTIYRVDVKSGVCPVDTSNSVTITVNAVPVGGTISGSTAFCEGANNGTLTLSGYTGSIVNWESSVDAGSTWSAIVNATSSQMYSNVLDTTWYRAIVTNGICGNDTSSLGVVTIYPKPQASFTVDTVCLGNPTTFVNTSTIAANFIQFNQWSFGDNAVSLATSPAHSYGSAGTFQTTLLTTSSMGCMDTAMLNVYVNALPPSTITASGPLQFCSTDSVILTAATGSYHYLWSTSDTTQSIVAKTSKTFMLTITDTLTGCFATNSDDVTVYPAPTVFAGNDTTVSLGSGVALNGTGVGIVSWNWFPNTGLSNPIVSDPVASPLVSTVYELTGTDVNGCFDKDSIMITVLVDYNVTISNLMTPNDDGYNDKWIIQNIENYPNTSVVIVNRDGQELYKSDSYDNTWDGTSSGKILPDGTYYYIVKFENSDKLYKGSITILKENRK